MTMPNSAKWARIALIKLLGCRTIAELEFWSIA